MVLSRLYKLWYLLIVPVFTFLSCRQVDVFEKNVVIPQHEWRSNFNVQGSFIISDTISSYDIYLVLRHTDDYAYNNIWLNIGLQAPGDSLYVQKVDLKLGDDANGWEGTGMNDIWELRKLLSGQPRRFKQSGKYNFSISQIMRNDPLADIMSAGLRIEKRKP